MATRILFSSSLLFFLITVTEVLTWTVDLPEVRKYFFEKHEKEMEISKNEYEDYANRDKIFYSNGQILKDNELHKEKDKYAAEFGYHSYMEKKVEEIAHDGSAYLEGLQRSLENFNTYIVECNNRNISVFRNETSLNSTTRQPLSVLVNSSTSTGTNNTQPTTARTSTLAPNIGMSCRQASEVSEKVRRYADLATWATRRLQDLAYAEKYQQTDKYEENELILKLAWFLDQLAQLTGYEPERKPYSQEMNSAVPTTSPVPPTLVPQTQELINSMMDCLKNESDVPATVRCQYMLPLPELVQQIVGGTSTRAPEVTSEVVPIPSSDSIPQQSMELLIAADDYRNPRRLSKRSPNHEEYYIPIPVHEKQPKPIVEFIVKKLTNLKEIVKTVKKHAVADFASQVATHKHIHKRSIDNNNALLVNKLSNISKPILKSNKTIVKEVLQHLPVPEDSFINTKSFKKRSIDDKTNDFNYINEMSNYISNVKSVKSSVKSIVKRSVDDPFGMLVNYYMKYKVWDGVNPLHDKNTKIQSNFDVNNNLQTKLVAKRSLFQKKNGHLLLKPVTYKPKNNLPKKQKQKIKNPEKKHKFIKKLHKITKRSLIYKDMYLPRIPFNPMGDISYYVKSKEDHNIRPSLTQASQVRLGLERAFQTGNIEVVRRYGANYNPAVPAPFYFGLLKGLADS